MSPAFDGEVFLGPTSLFAKLANASAEGDRGRRHRRMKAGIKTMILETISIIGSRRGSRATSKDHLEGAKSFVEKRAANFKGK
jgi:hypothetical protein